MPLFSSQLADVLLVTPPLYVVVILICLQRLRVGDSSLNSWVCAYGFECLHFACSAWGKDSSPRDVIAADAASLGFALFLLKAIHLSCLPPKKSESAASLHKQTIWLGMLSSFAVLFDIFSESYFWRAVPLHLIVGSVLLTAAYKCWNHYRANRVPFHLAFAILISIRSAHLFLPLFFSSETEIRQIEFVVDDAADLTIGIVLLIFILAARIGHTEQRLHEREIIFEKIFQLAPELLVIYSDTDGRFVDVNRHWESMTGRSYRESLSLTGRELDLWESLEQRELFFKTLRENSELRNMRARHKHKNGHHYLVDISAVRFEVGKESYICCVVQDVTAAQAAEEFRSQVEKELRERERRFSAIFELVPEAISIVSLDTNLVVDVNHRWEQLTGYTKAEVIGKKTADDLGLWMDHEHRSQFMQLLERDGAVREHNTVLGGKDGTFLHARSYCTLFESGNTQYLLAAMQSLAELREQQLARERAEFSLHKSERQLHVILNAMGEGVIVRRKDGRRVLSNSAAERIYGVQGQDLDFIEDYSLVDYMYEDGLLLNPADLPEWRTLSTGMPQRNVVLGIRQKGKETTWLYVSTDPIFSDVDPSLVELVVIVMVDISRQRQAEMLLREREALLSMVFQLVPDTLTITNLNDGRYVDVNRNWGQFSGYSREEAIGHTSIELKMWADPAQRAELVRRVLAEGEVRGMQIVFRHKLGHEYRCRAFGTKFASGGENYLLLSSIDIEQELAAESARNQAEKLLRENEYKYSTVFQLSPIALGLVSMETSKIIETNDAWQSQFGYTRSEVVGRTALELNFYAYPEERNAMLSELDKVGQLDRFEVHHRHKSGQILTCLMSARQFNLHGESTIIFSLLDMTRQYEVEREIREMTAELEERVKQRTLKLERANHELGEAMATLERTKDKLVHSEKMAALGSLVAGVAHELNTPIGNSVTVASTLEDKTRVLLQEFSGGGLRRSSLEQYLQEVATATALLMRTLSVARDLVFSFKQVAVDQSSSQRREFDLKYVLEEIVVTLAPMYKKSFYTLSTKLEADIKMDSFPGPLGQIITNFLTNALAHAFEGRNQGAMALSCRRIVNEQVEIIFSDDGIGIRDADQKRVFDPFFTTKLGQGGSGLGMHIVYNLVTGVLGGEIKLTSKPGHGTTYILTLPLRAPQLVGDDL